MPADLLMRYRALVAAREIERDRAQEAVVRRLAALAKRLTEPGLARKSSALGRLFGARERQQEPIKGVYLFGDVGRGKTMLMDLFFAAIPLARKRRVHFHEFMGEVHERVRGLRQKLLPGEPAEDPIRLAAAAIAQESSLVCFDELHVTDIADAMILGRLFARLFELGVVVVATSNVAPEELYKDGLNRALFAPFIALIERHMEVVELAARTDYRLQSLAGAAVWHVPADRNADAALDAAWRRLTGGRPGAPQELHLLGRVLVVPRAAKGVGRFTFHELCEAPLSAADYLKLARAFHTLIIDHIPVIGAAQRNEAKRFIMLIDTLYDNSVKVLASAQAEPEMLYRGGDGFEAQEYKRTASRLLEMRSQAYLALPHGRRDSQASAWVDGIVET